MVSESLTIDKIIDLLSKEDKERVSPIGIKNPHSYRGDYNYLSFEPSLNMRISEIIQVLKNCIGESYTGWKGGEFLMDSDTPCYLSMKGSSLGYELSYIVCSYIFELNNMDDFISTLEIY